MKGTLLIVVTCAVFVCGRDVQERYIECLGEFGCFNSDGIIPVPQRPTIVNTHLNLYTRTSSHSPAVSFDVDHYASHVGQFASVLDSSKDTKVIIHGYLNAGNEPWVTDMTAKLLQKVYMVHLLWSMFLNVSYYPSHPLTSHICTVRISHFLIGWRKMNYLLTNRLSS